MKTTREPLGGSTILADIIKMAEGNPGAASVLGMIFQAGPFGYIDILNLDDMNIRGPEIWIGYKDFCGSDLTKFLEKVRERDRAMVDFINKHRGGSGWLAVESGASFMEGHRPKKDGSEAVF